MCGRLELGATSDSLVDPSERQDTIRVPRELPLVAELLQYAAGVVEVAGHLGDPRARQASELVDRTVAREPARGDRVAARPRLSRSAREKETERLLQIETRRRLLDQRRAPERDAVRRMSLRLERQVEDRSELREGGALFGALGVNLSPASDGLGELPADVFDLGEEVEGFEIVGRLFEHRTHFPLGVVDLVNLDEDAGVGEAKRRVS